jgi:DNA-binding transcriptional regulator LsrR (DeoR family)
MGGSAVARQRSDGVAESELAARAAWLHYAGGLTQSAIAARFDIPVTRAHRMIARAAREGLVRVFVDAEVAGCVALEERLKARFALSSCIVAPDLADGNPLRAIGLVAARMLTGVLERRAPAVIGIGHGRTLSAAVDQLPALDARGFRFVSLLGGLTRSFAANPYDVIHRLTGRTGAEGFLVPAPLFANSPEDRSILLSQTGLAEIRRLWSEAEICLLGVGAVDPEGSIARANVFDPEESLASIRAAGARAEVLGQFLDADGRLLGTRYDGRVIAADLFALKGREVHAVAGGEGKAAALASALASGVFTGLITDEATARRLVEDAGEALASPALAGAGL